MMSPVSMTRCRSWLCSLSDFPEKDILCYRILFLIYRAYRNDATVDCRTIAIEEKGKGKLSNRIFFYISIFSSLYTTMQVL